MDQKRLLEALQSFVKGEVTIDKAVLDLHSRDASIFSVTPSVVVYPRQTEDLQRLIKFVIERKKLGENISLTGRSAGTDMSGGSLTSSIVLDFTKYFNHILETGEGYGIAEPGVYYRDFEKATMEKGYLMPSYPASRELCAIGGIVNNNSGGEKTLTYGKTEKYVAEVTLVLSNGDVETFKPLSKEELEAKIAEGTFASSIYKNIFELIQKNQDLIEKAKPQVSKNSAGYYIWNVYNKETGVFDIPKLICGSQGTLGLMTKVKFNLVKPRTHSRMLVIFLKDLKPLGEVVNHVLQYKPESFESYDDHTFKIALKFFPQIAKSMKGNMLTLGLQFLPEFWMALSGGIPKLILMAEFTGDTEEEVDAELNKAYESIKALNLQARKITTAKEAKKYWTFRRESFNLLRSNMKGLRTAPFIDDFVVRPEFLPEFLPKLDAILGKYDLIYTIAGHVGDGNFHIIPLMDLTLTQTKKTIEALSKKVYALVAEYHGSITGEHNDGLIRTPFLSTMYSEEIIKIFEEIKTIFDPLGIFNPGKKVHGDLKYSFAHIDSGPKTS